MARIDLDGDDAQDDLAEALRQLERQQKKPAEGGARRPSEQDLERRKQEREREADHRRSRDEVQGAVAAIRERQIAQERAVPSRRARPSLARWIVLGIIALAVVVSTAIALWPEPLPPPAVSPQEAVRGFWGQIIAGKYEGAPVYYPALIDKYGSRKQAALFLEQELAADPPTKVNVSEPEALPDSDDLRVGYEVWRRSGRPRAGEFIVRDTGAEETGYIIITGL